jgi:hypothetical protein
MVKKLSPKSTMPPPPRNSDEALADIKSKLHSSTVLNGGFDILLHKIDKIEQGQGQIVGKVEKIHDAIYDPSEGIFSKLSETKVEYTQQFGALGQKMFEISEWKKHKEKVDDKLKSTNEDLSIKILTMEKSVDTLSKSRATVWGVLKWAGVAIGGAIVTLLVKFLESKLSGH